MGRSEAFINKLQHFSYCSQRVTKGASWSGATGIHVLKRKIRVLSPPFFFSSVVYNQGIIRWFLGQEKKQISRFVLSVEV